MAKATKKSKEHHSPVDELSISNAPPKRVKTWHQIPTPTDDKKNRLYNSKSSKKVRRAKLSIVLSLEISPPPALLTLSCLAFTPFSTHSPSPTVPFTYSSFSKTHMSLSPYSVELPGTNIYQEEQENHDKDHEREDA